MKEFKKPTIEVIDICDDIITTSSSRGHTQTGEWPEGEEEI